MGTPHTFTVSITFGGRSCRKCIAFWGTFVQEVHCDHFRVLRPYSYAFLSLDSFLGYGVIVYWHGITRIRRRSSYGVTSFAFILFASRTLGLRYSEVSSPALSSDVYSVVFHRLIAWFRISFRRLELAVRFAKLNRVRCFGSTGLT